MRAKEFIPEAAKKQDALGLHNPQFSGVHLMPDVDQGYELYRIGLDMAVADGRNSRFGDKTAHPSADKSVIVAYSQGDHDIIKQVLKHRGIKHKDTSSGPAREHDGSNTVSPVAKFKPTKRAKG